jgi:hypothetical protein
VELRVLIVLIVAGITVLAVLGAIAAAIMLTRKKRPQGKDKRE